MDCSMPGFPVHCQLLEFTQTHVHQVGDAFQPYHPMSSPSPPAFNLSINQGFFQWVSSSHQMSKVLEFQLQHQSFQWTPRTDLFQNRWLNDDSLRQRYLKEMCLVLAVKSGLLNKRRWMWLGIKVLLLISQRIDSFELCVGEDSRESLGLQGDQTNQS